MHQPKPPAESHGESNPQSARPQPRPLRVHNFESTVSTRPGTSGGDGLSPRPSTHRSPRHPKVEVTIVGRGTQGLGSQARELHQQLQDAMYKQWLEKKEKERKEALQEQRQKEMAHAKVTNESLSKERIEQRKTQLYLRAYDKEIRAKKAAEEFSTERKVWKTEAERAAQEELDFRKTYSEEVGEKVRAQLRSAQEHRHRLESFKLPELDEWRNELKSEKQELEKLRAEVGEQDHMTLTARRNYVLEMKDIAHQNLLDDKEHRMATVAEQRKWLQQKEDARKAERNALKAELAAAAKEARERQRMALRRVKFEAAERKRLEVEKFKEDLNHLGEPINETRVQWLERMKEVVKQRHEEDRDLSQKSGRKAFFEKRKAEAADLEAELKRCREEVKREKEMLYAEKRAMHHEILEAARASSARRATRSPPRAVS
jgi:hypothetical protein